MKKLLGLLAVLSASSGTAQAQSQFQFPTAPWSAFAPDSVQCGWLYGANFNVTTDQPITISVPSATYVVDKIYVSNPSVSMTTAAGGFYTGSGKTGVIVVAATQAYSALTTNAANTTGNAMVATIATAGLTTMFGGPTQGANAVTTLYFSLTTAQGAAATGDIRVVCKPLY